MLHRAITVVTKNTLHDKGLVATERIYKGEVVSTLDPDCPTCNDEQFNAMTEELQAEYDLYSYEYCEDRRALEPANERYMNHSCDPNTCWKNGETLLASRDVEAGEEITYDYATTDIRHEWQIECHCGSPRCRQVVTNQDYKDPVWQQRYGVYLPEHTLKAIEKSNLNSI